MGEKPVTERRGNPDQAEDNDPQLKVEVVEDLDLPEEDADGIRGGLSAWSCACGVHPDTTRLTMATP